jgi:hypothetical protein
MCLKWVNSKIKKMTWLDIGFVKLAVAGFILFIAKIWTPILSLQWYWYLVVMALALIRPLYKIFK